MILLNRSIDQSALTIRENEARLQRERQSVSIPPLADMKLVKQNLNSSQRASILINEAQPYVLDNLNKSQPHIAEAHNRDLSAQDCRYAVDMNFNQQMH